MRVALASWLASLHVQRVIAERQILRDPERRLSDPAPIEVVRRRVVLELVQTRANRAVLQPNPHADGFTVGDVHPERGGPIACG